MRSCILLLILGLPGCALISDSVHLVSQNLRQGLEDCREWHRDVQWASEAWREESSRQSFSIHHAEGFKEGYAHYLYEGGTGEPPLLPPPRYRGLRYQSGEGYQAVQEWFAGYRHGSSMAQKSGLRVWITGPSSLSASEGALPAGSFMPPRARLEAPVDSSLIAPSNLASPGVTQAEHSAITKPTATLGQPLSEE
jgi:hypothetical protein